MAKKLRRIALVLNLQWPYKRHAGIFAGTQQYAEEHGWRSIVDEFAHDTLSAARGATRPYDGLIARASLALVRQAKRCGVPLVNVWASSPAHGRLAAVYPDFRLVGEMCAEHLLARGFRNFGAIAPSKSQAQETVVGEFDRLVREAGFVCDKVKIPQNPWRDVANWRQTERAIERCLDAWQPP
ncbi:MAG: hypothetical protein KDA41_01395, partial [Planctomycetales bacterium]|nr:hypothetical protein [Planctomycetales bacterium]